MVVVVGQLLRDLIGLRHEAVEDFERDGDEAGMRDPGAVVAVGGLALLVGADLAMAFSLATGSDLMGMSADMPPMAWTLRRWQVLMQSLE